MTDTCPKCVKLQAKIERLNHVLSIVLASTEWQPGEGVIPTRKPSHGSCCSCQKCGYFYDECVCAHNLIEAALRDAGYKAAEAAKEKRDG